MQDKDDVAEVKSRQLWGLVSTLINERPDGLRILLEMIIQQRVGEGNDFLERQAQLARVLAQVRRDVDECERAMVKPSFPTHIGV